MESGEIYIIGLHSLYTIYIFLIWTYLILYISVALHLINASCLRGPKYLSISGVWVAAVLVTYFGFSRSETSQWQKCSIRKSNRKLERMLSHILKRLSDSSSSLEIRFFGVNHRCRSVSLVVCWRNSKVILTVFKIQNGGKTKFKSSILVLSCSKSPLADFTPTGKKAAEIDCITTCFSFCYCYSEREAKKTSAENRQDGRLCLKMCRKRFKWKWRQKNSRTYNQRMKPDRNFQEGKIQSKSSCQL